MHSLIRVLPRTRFATHASTTPGATEVILQKYVVTAPFVSMALILRLHAVPTTGTWTLFVRPASLSEDEPDLFFTTTTGQISQTFTSSSDNLLVVAFTAPVPDRVSVILGMPATSNAITTISVDLLGRDA